MARIINEAPHVETELGRELRDICAIGVYSGMNEKQIHAALLGRIGVCATSWGDPYDRKGEVVTTTTIFPPATDKESA